MQAARAAMDVATKDFERQKQLFQQSYISQAALDHAESQSRSTRAQVAAQGAQAGVTRTQSGFFVVKAPYAGIVSDVPVALGDMAMPASWRLVRCVAGSLVASVPLTGQAWRPLAEGELLAVRHREVLATHLPAPA